MIHEYIRQKYDQRRLQGSAFFNLIKKIQKKILLKIKTWKFLKKVRIKLKKKFKNTKKKRKIKANGYQTRMPKLQQWLLEQLARYFIIIVSGFLLFISLSGEVVGYKIIYMIFFLFSGIVFQACGSIFLFYNFCLYF